MSKTDREKNINRILVSLDFDTNNVGLLESLVSLASQLNADLCGLLIEESELQHVANLPFSREITFPSALTRNLSSTSIARHLKEHAEQSRQLIEKLSELADVACSFRSTKSTRIESVLDETIDSEVIVLFPGKYNPVNKRYIKSSEDILNPVVLLYKEPEESQKAIDIVLSLNEMNKLHHLIVLTKEGETEDISEKLYPVKNIKSELKRIDGFEISPITSLLDTLNPGLVILPLDDDIRHQAAQIKIMLETLLCPIVLIR